MSSPSRSSPPRPTPPPRSSGRPAVSGPRRPTPPHRFVPDDSLFTASYSLIIDNSSTDDDRFFKARTQLPTLVKVVQCTRMWISAARLSAENITDKILQSLAGDSQPAIWQAHRASLRIFVRIPYQGISFLCTSNAALHSLVGMALQVCGSTVHIRKYSKYDKLYFVDLTRLPGDVPDRAIYNWFAHRGSRPVLITPTYVAGELKSRDRTVYFHAVQ
uniref:Uncharacterized protein n=1 Tax=Peronospora matthiolae TaxID=2874970 RepID=A0AAV1UWW9_9STRA